MRGFTVEEAEWEDCLEEEMKKDGRTGLGLAGATGRGMKGPRAIGLDPFQQ